MTVEMNLARYNLEYGVSGLVNMKYNFKFFEVAWASYGIEKTQLNPSRWLFARRSNRKSILCVEKPLKVVFSVI